MKRVRKAPPTPPTVQLERFVDPSGEPRFRSPEPGFREDGPSPVHPDEFGGSDEGSHYMAQMSAERLRAEILEREEAAAVTRLVKTQAGLIGPWRVTSMALDAADVRTLTKGCHIEAVRRKGDSGGLAFVRVEYDDPDDVARARKAMPDAKIVMVALPKPSAFPEAKNDGAVRTMRSAVEELVEKAFCGDDLEREELSAACEACLTEVGL